MWTKFKAIIKMELCSHIYRMSLFGRGENTILVLECKNCIMTKTFPVEQTVESK